MEYRKLLMGTVALLSVAFTGCMKPSDSPLQTSHPLSFNKDNLAKTIAAVDSLSLFYEAVQRLGYTGLFESTSNYTVMAPGNGAMQAGGLNSSQIRALPLDSLRKLIAYHILPGAYADSSLKSLAFSQVIETLRADTGFVPGQGYKVTKSYLYIQQGDSLYLDDYAAAGNAPPIQASNGYIYPIRKVLDRTLTDNSRSLWDVISTDPDLSMYLAAIRLQDSIRTCDLFDDNIYYAFYLGMGPDSNNFTAKKIREDGYVNYSKTPTLLAPTNKAFQDAGFHSIDDLRQFALRYPIGIRPWVNDDFTEYKIDVLYSSLDTLLGQHLLHNDGVSDGSQRFPVRILYSDMLKGKVNNGIFNKRLRDLTAGFRLYLRYPWDLQFSQAGGVAYVQWHPGSPKIMIPRDTDPKRPARNYSLENGAIYKIDGLFYPFH
ncbi:fasciclin domain-containing protein [Chitinophaga barathri]|uniref:Fasciclin domain-containing protein n=1 Tax=Chitinophaga barathri TaxID=1647451 RepID=A0A3N4MC30_9BACT|nr:fasciclin domain-containing protein [Chitinophaga barathri]RPD39396.1 fasciclin domain-containing protein [Chitinophaga barathri]